LDPLLQFRLGFYSILTSLAFSGAILAVLYAKFAKFAEIVMALTDVEDEIKVLFSSYLNDTWLWLIGLSVFFFLLNLFISVFFTHKLIGPTVAFMRTLRDLREERYQSRVFLRKGDAFSYVANELNALAAKLEAEKKP
jgi:hypothetical protein